MGCCLNGTCPSRGFLEDSCQRARILHMTGMLVMYLIGLFVW